MFYFFKEEVEQVYYEHPEFQADWISIDSVEKQPKVYASQKFIQLSKKNVPQVPLLNINLSDSFAFKKLPGIVDKYASRIVRYRNLLGGFYAKEQLLKFME